MNYVAHYDRLIARARVRASTKENARTLMGYVERHHIIPVCLGGNGCANNIAYLTGEEHYVAHQLLVKMHPHSKPIIAGALLMAQQSTGNKSHAWLRRRKATAMLGNTISKGRHPTAETLAKMSAVRLGKPQSKEHAAKRGLKMIGNKHGLGKKHGPRTAEQRERMSIAHRGIKMPPRTPEHSANLTAALRSRFKYGITARDRKQAQLLFG